MRRSVRGFPPASALSKTKELRGKGDLPLPKNAPWQVSKSGYRLKLRLTFMQEAGFREKANIHFVGQAYVVHIRQRLCLRIV